MFPLITLNFKVITFTEEELSHPFGLALWGDRMFWSDWVTRTIHSADKKTGGNRQNVVLVSTTLISYF